MEKKNYVVAIDGKLESTYETNLMGKIIICQEIP